MCFCQPITWNMLFVFIILKNSLPGNARVNSWAAELVSFVRREQASSSFLLREAVNQYIKTCDRWGITSKGAWFISQCKILLLPEKPRVSHIHKSLPMAHLLLLTSHHLYPMVLQLLLLQILSILLRACLCWRGPYSKMTLVPNT